MNVLDRVSKLPIHLIRRIKETLDADTYIDVLYCERLKHTTLKKTIHNNYYDTFVDDVNGHLASILTCKIPTEQETLNELTGESWYFASLYPLKIPDELYYNIFKHNLYIPLMKLINNDNALSGLRYVGPGPNSRGIKFKDPKHPLLQEVRNLISDYYLMEKPSVTNERIMDRYNKNLEHVMEKLKVNPLWKDSSIVYILREIRSFNNEFDNKVKSILLKYLKAMVVLTKPYCNGLVNKILQERTEKDIQIDEDRDNWKKGLKTAIKEARLMGREERYERKRLERVKQNEIIELRRIVRRNLTEERREKKKAEQKKKKEIAREKERKKNEKVKEKERKKKEKAKEARDAIKRQAKIVAKALKKAVVMERTIIAALPSIRKLFK